MKVMEEIFEITNCIEILANDIEVDTGDEYMVLWNQASICNSFQDIQRRM